MKEVRYFYAPDALSSQELPADEAAHAVRVLRLKEGDEIFLMDGCGSFHRAEVTMAQGKRCSYDIKETLPQEPLWNGHIHLAMAPTKMMERVEWMAEKATEIGCDEFSFLLCKFSERKQMRQDRVEKTVVSAVKQSRKAWMPKVNELIDFKSFVTAEREGGKYICHCYDEIPKTDFYTEIQASCANADNTGEHAINIIGDNGNGADEHANDITVLIGPEGDFSIDEVRLAIENGYKSVTLGEARLRTETAALSAIMMSQLARRK